MKCPLRKITRYSKQIEMWNARVGHYQVVVPCKREEAECISEELQGCVGTGCQAYNGNGGGCKMLAGKSKGEATT